MVAADIYFKVFVILEVLLTVSYGFTIKMDDDHIAGSVLLSDVLLSGTKLEHKLVYPSVHHYARHGLCHTFKGKQHFYNAMKRKLCDMRLSFTADFVINLCRHKNKMLDMWVAELFDLDRDGFISHNERRYYVEDD